MQKLHFINHATKIHRGPVICDGLT